MVASGLGDAERRDWEREPSAHLLAEVAPTRLEKLQRVTAALSEALTETEVAAVMVDEGVSALEADAGVVVLLDESATVLEVVHAHGYPADQIDRWRTFPVDAPLPLAEAVRKEDIVTVASIEERDRLFPAVAGTPSRYRTTISTPLIFEGRALGALGLSFVETRHLGEADHLLMRTIVQQCAQALGRAHLYEAERRARSAAEKAQEDLAFLAAVSEALSTSVDYRDRLAEVARMMVPRMADWCVIEIVEDDGTISSLEISHVDPDKVALARDLSTRYPKNLQQDFGIAKVIRDGEPSIYFDIPDEALQAAARDPEHLELMRSLHFSSAMSFPLRGREATLGALTLVTEGDRKYTESDVTLAGEFARRAGLAIENAGLFQDISEAKDRFAHVARTLQKSLLPPELPRIPGVELAARYRAAGEGNEVGGDFYDAFQTEAGAWAVVLGDVMGKGPKAAALTGLARHTIRALGLAGHSPNEVLRRLNSAILSHSAETEFVTVAYGILERDEQGGRLNLAAGGHYLPLLVRRNGTIEKVGTPGTILGAFSDPEIAESTIELEEGDSIVFYSDGVVEEGDGEAEFGEQKLMSVVGSREHESAAEIAEALETAVVDFSPSEPRDDIAILVVKLGPYDVVGISATVKREAASV